MASVLSLAGAQSAPLPDPQLRKLIRFGLTRKVATLRQRTREAAAAAESEFLAQMRASPIALATADAKRQHYEVPAAFFATVLGPHRKYSECYFEPGVTDLGAAETAMLDRVINRAELADGQTILDLGCGWGALALELARRFPRASIEALSHSASQRSFIEAQARERGLDNLRVHTADIIEWQPQVIYDRIVSIEMFEHMRNLEALLARIAGWLRIDGQLFVHIFTHVDSSYVFEDDWTARNFFTGGMMPAADLLMRLQHHFELLGHWRVDGFHYAKTAEAWLERLDTHRVDAVAALATGDDPRPVEEQISMWRMFFIVTAESFGFDGGRQWLISHYLFRRRNHI